MYEVGGRVQIQLPDTPCRTQQGHAPSKCSPPHLQLTGRAQQLAVCTRARPLFPPVCGAAAADRMPKCSDQCGVCKHDG